MKICFVGPANSLHIVKWCTWFSNHGHDVHVISFSPAVIPNTDIHVIDVGVSVGSSDLTKIKYLFAGKQIKDLIDAIRPDIVNAHYATSYGAALALSGVKNYIVSVWGADVYDFPKKSIFHKFLVKYSLKKANYLFSTSHAMAMEAGKYTDKKFEITPFGVDMELFNPNKRTRKEDDGSFIVGTVKSLSVKYGISYLLRAVAEVKKQGIVPIKLRIAGKGPQEAEYHKLAAELGIDDITTWLGVISQEEAAKEWANMDVAIIPSILESESFGVSAVEAQACGIPVIISDIPGLMEATKPGKTSVVVPRCDYLRIAEQINNFYYNLAKKKGMGYSGRIFVMENYELNHCFSQVENLFSNYVYHFRSES